MAHTYRLNAGRESLYLLLDFSKPATASRNPRVTARKALAVASQTLTLFEQQPQSSVSPHVTGEGTYFSKFSSIEFLGQWQFQDKQWPTQCWGG